MIEAVLFDLDGTFADTAPEPIEAWGADHIVDHAGEIAALAGVAC